MIDIIRWIREKVLREGARPPPDRTDPSLLYEGLDQEEALMFLEMAAANRPVCLAPGASKELRDSLEKRGP